MANQNKEKNVRLDRLLSRPGIVVAPGAADGLGARLVELAGFDVIYMSGFAVAASAGAFACRGRPRRPESAALRRGGTREDKQQSV